MKGWIRDRETDEPTLKNLFTWSQKKKKKKKNKRTGHSWPFTSAAAWNICTTKGECVPFYCCLLVAYSSCAWSCDGTHFGRSGGRSSSIFTHPSIHFDCNWQTVCWVLYLRGEWPSYHLFEYAGRTAAAALHSNNKLQLQPASKCRTATFRWKINK